MLLRLFAFFALAFGLFGTQCLAQESNTCFGGEGLSCTLFFNPGMTTGTYNFGNDGQLTVQFDKVLTSFALTVTVDHTPDPIDTSVFPANTSCVKYAFNGNSCAEYDFSGGPGPNGVPVKNVDYKHLITLTLSYLTFQTVHTPAFGHAPGDNATAVYNEDILTAYSSFPVPGDPTMKGTTPGLSAVAALDEPFTETGDSFCSLSIQPAQPVVGQEIEVEYRLTNGADCTKGIRDKTARFSLAQTDPSSGNFISFPTLRDKEEGNKFHWDNKATTNELDVSTVGLQPGHYSITVFSTKVSPHSVDFDLAPAPPDPH
jgi:hypothetical protein